LGNQTTKINDGTNTSAVKAASTAAVATDPALVVAISPNNTVAISATSLPLPTGAATSANQTTLGSQTTKLNDGTTTVAVKAASTAAVAADPALVVAISPNNTVVTAGNKSNNGGVPGATNIGSLPAVATAAAPSYTEGNQVAASTLLNGALRTDNTSWLGSTAPTVGSKTSANSVPVVIASDQGTLTVAAAGSATGTSTSQASSITNITLLSANASRKGATVYNDSTKSLFLKLGATASSTSFTSKLAAGAYFEVPFNYTGIIDGLWDVANGSARMTELT
jgi:hypothetical protein